MAVEWEVFSLVVSTSTLLRVPTPSSTHGFEGQSVLLVFHPGVHAASAAHGPLVFCASRENAP